MRLSGFALLLALLLLTSSGIVAADGPTDQEVTNIGKELKCPVCQNISVADSPSELAQQMRGIIRQKLEAGESKDDIVRYMVDRYGEEILLNPPKKGFTAFVWAVPPALLALISAILVWNLRRPRSPDEAAEEELELSQEELRKYEERLNRELAS